MKEYIKQQLINETTEKSIKLFKKNPNRKISEIVNFISNKYNLTEDEKNDLFLNTEQKLKDGDSKDIDVKFDKSKILPNSIDFNTVEDMEKACNILMKRGLGWKVKGDENYSFLQFEDLDDVKKAIIFLKNEWNFIEKNQKKVALISFDNYSDFKKVFEFMSRNNMIIESNEDKELSDDIEDLLPETVSFIAKEQSKSVLDSNKRRINVSKNWK